MIPVRDSRLDSRLASTSAAERHDCHDDFDMDRRPLVLILRSSNGSERSEHHSCGRNPIVLAVQRRWPESAFQPEYTIFLLEFNFILHIKLDEVLKHISRATVANSP